MSFDLLFLHGRMRHHGIDDDKWLYQRVFRGPVIIDLLQLHLPAERLPAQGPQARRPGPCLADFRSSPSTGAGAIEHYFQGDYDSILQYSEREFIYPDMFAKIQRDGLVTRETAAGLDRALQPGARADVRATCRTNPDVEIPRNACTCA